MPVKSAAKAAKLTQLTINGERVESAAGTLAGLVDDLTGYNPKAVATALNGTFVARTARASAALKTGDTIEIVSARQGG